MKRKTYVRHAISVVAILLGISVLAACSSSTSGESSSTSGEKAATDHNDADVAFASLMIPHHQQAIEMADMTEGKGTSAEVVSLAAQIKAAQGPEVKVLQGWLDKWDAQAGASGMDHSGMGQSGTTDSDMGPGMSSGSSGSSGMGDSGSGSVDGMMSDADMASLSAATGVEFEKMWLTMMTEHHQGAVTMAETELKDGTFPAAKALAQTIIDAQNGEIETMKTMLAGL